MPEKENTATSPVEERQNEERVDRLGTGSIPKLMFEFAIPAIMGLVVNALYNLIDSIFLGHGVGEAGLATATVALPAMTIGIAIALLIGNGGNALAALRLGEGKRNEAEVVLGNTLTLSLITGVIVAIAGFVAIDPLLSISGATPEIWDSAKAFLQILCGGFFLQGIGMGLNNFIRTAGDPKRALYTMVVGAVVCTVMNYFFVLEWGWGVRGSAYATLIGQGASAVMVLWYFIFSKRAPFKLRLRNLPLRIKIVGTILALGSASFVLQAAMAVVSFILNNLLVKYGALDPIGSAGALASIGVVQRIMQFTVFPMIGVSIAAQPILGYNYGAHNFWRVKRTLRVALIWAVSLGVFFWLVVHIFPELIVGAFGVEQDLVDFTVFALKVQLFALPVVGIQVIGANYFQATGQPLKSMLLSLTRQIIFLIPLLFILPEVLPRIFPQLTSLDALYFSVPIADVLAIGTVVVFLIWEARKLNRKIKELKAADDVAVTGGQPSIITR